VERRRLFRRTGGRKRSEKKKKIATRVGKKELILLKGVFKRPKNKTKEKNNSAGDTGN